MRAVHVALLCLGSLALLGAGAARLQVAPGFKRRWTKWAPSRAKRDAGPASPLGGRAAAAAVQPLVRPQDAKEDPRAAPHSRPEDARIRVKRYRPGASGFHFQHPRVGCRFGTCTIQQLAHQIYQLTDKDKDGAAPASKISPQGYGRRRRSVPVPGRTRSSPRRGTVAEAPDQPGWLRAQLRALSRRT
ncbi:pro-adrenomedullin [Carettochelys insculpta]|uniref:pro-adrenomedullin n=1 Tax=Carettochelys insculpta TaxID=44489 RepID=UPI003EBC0417